MESQTSRVYRPGRMKMLVSQRDDVIEGLARAIRSRRLSVSENDARSLACLWQAELDAIIGRMFEVSQEMKGVGLHIESRKSAIQEVAKLELWLREQIIDWKVAHADEGTFDVARERQVATSVTGQGRLENTARICAEHFWNKCVDRWRLRWRLVVTGDRAAPLWQPRRAQFVRCNHWSPVFANREWADPNTGDIRVFTRAVGGAIRSSDMHYRKWGHEQFLYSRSLEDWLSLIDHDGASTQRKLVDVVPLTELDKRRWIAFLALQFLRTPSCIQMMLARLRNVLPKIAPHYPRDVASLKRANETVFWNNHLYAGFHDRIAPKAWTLLRTPPAVHFIRPDQPVLLRGSERRGDWMLMYPMTPNCLFKAGPELGRGYDADYPETRDVDATTCSTINQLLAAHARESVISVPSTRDDTLRRVLNEHFGAAAPVGPEGVVSDDALWGPLTLARRCESDNRVRRASSRGTAASSLT